VTLAPPRPGTRIKVRGVIGESAERPDAADKVKGQFEYASDLRERGMLFGHTLRSPHPFARIRSIDTTAAKAMPGVRAVLTAADLPTRALEAPSPAHARRGARPAFWPEYGDLRETTVYDGTALRPGNVVEGPALVETPYTTIVIPPGLIYSINQHELGILE